MVVGAVPTQQARGGLVPQPPGRNSLCRKCNALRHAEPGIAQNSPHQLVAQHFGPVWPQRDRPLQTGLPNEPVRLFRVVCVLISDGRQPGIKDGGAVGADGVDGHGGLLGFDESTIRGRGGKTIGQNA